MSCGCAAGIAAVRPKSEGVILMTPVPASSTIGPGMDVIEGTEKYAVAFETRNLRLHNDELSCATASMTRHDVIDP